MTGSTPPGSNRTSAVNCASPGAVLPSRELQNWVGGGGAAAFKAIGNEFLDYLVDLCGLQPGDAVLDVGCGSGRMALPLTKYLNPEGRYAGFDVSREAIAWCTDNISKSRPNFDFTVVDIQNGAYNPTGKYKSSHFRFPYPDGSFDVVFLASVFTHMLPSDVKHYLHEIVRVLKPGGRSLITFFLLNEESSALIKEGKGLLKFEHQMPGYRTTNVKNPESAIAYPEAFVRYLYEECGLELREPLHYGTWCGRINGMSGQDVIVAAKAATRNGLAWGPHVSDIKRPKGSTKQTIIPLSDENIAVAEAMGIDPAINENDFIFQLMDRYWAADGGRERAVKEYFKYGRRSAKLSKSMIRDVRKVYDVAGSAWAPRRVLDFASGYGCTARHMRHVFHDSLFASCDIDIDAMNFTKDVLGVESYISSPVPEELKLPPQDVILAHSFFSHVPATTWARWLKALHNALAPGGVLIFTTYGFALDKRGYPGLNVGENGFGFIPQSKQGDLDAKYGLTISHPRWVLAVLASMPGLRLSKFQEGLWRGTYGAQDTYVCVKELDNRPGYPASAPDHSTTPVSRSVQEDNSDLPRFGRSISFGKTGHSEEVIGPGWSVQEDNYRWMTGGFSVLALPMTTESNAANFILMLRVTPFTANGQIDYQRCTVVCGAETVAEVKLRAAYAGSSSWIGFRITAEAVVSDKVAILFIHPDAGNPQKLGISPDCRELAIAVHEAVLLPVTEADELRGWRGRTGRVVSSDWRARALAPDWKKIAYKFQSMGQDCEFGLVQRQCGAEPLGLFRFSLTWQHALIQCLRSEFSELTDEQKLNVVTNPGEDYFSEYKSLDLVFHTFVPIAQNQDVDGLRRKELTRVKMLVRLFREDLEDGDKVFVLSSKHLPLDEFEVLPVVSLMRRYNPRAALLWVTVAGPAERHLVGQCEMIGKNLLKGYIDRFADTGGWDTISLECWKNILMSALQALDKPIPAHAQDLPPDNDLSKDPFILEPLRAVKAIDGSPALGLVGHIGYFGDAVNDGAAFINIPDSFPGAMQGFQLSISPTLERQIEYRGRRPDGSWTDWRPGNSFVGSRGKSQSLIGAAARLNGELQKEFNLQLLCRFENDETIHSAGPGEDCTTETGTHPLRGLQIILSRRPTSKVWSGPASGPCKSSDKEAENTRGTK